MLPIQNTAAISRAAALFVVLYLSGACNAPAAPLRQVISLNGPWQVAEGPMDRMPAGFDRTVPVPGLIDLAQPPLAEVGTPKSNSHRRAFWYRRTFRIDGNLPAVARLKIHKACYGTAVYLNGRFVGEHLPCFTPFTLDVGRQLKGDGRLNELVVRVGAIATRSRGAFRTAGTWKRPLHPGHLRLRGIDPLRRAGTSSHFQAVPELSRKVVRVVVMLCGGVRPVSTPLTCHVREAVGGKLVGSAEVQGVALAAGEEMPVELCVPLEPCRQWSPEDPFLYRLEVTTSGDTLSTRFGMRTFSFDPTTRRAMLNGRPYYYAQHKCLHLPFLRRRGPGRPAVAPGVGAAIAPGVSRHELELGPLLHRLSARAVVRDRR